MKVVVAVGVGVAEGAEAGLYGESESEEVVIVWVVSTTTVPVLESRRRRRRVFPEMFEPAVAMVVVRVPWV